MVGLHGTKHPVINHTIVLELRLEYEKCITCNDFVLFLLFNPKFKAKNMNTVIFYIWLLEHWGNVSSLLISYMSFYLQETMIMYLLAAALVNRMISITKYVHLAATLHLTFGI